MLSQDEADRLRLLELEEEEYQYQKARKPKAPSMMESAMLGAEQGATASFGDELSGLTARGVDWAQGLFGESPVEMAARMKAEGVKIPKGVPTSRDELYKQTRDEARAKYAEAQEANPYSFGGGALATGLATSALMPGAGATTVGKMAGSGAIQGAATALGASDSEGAGGMAVDTALGALLGAGGGVVGKYAGDAVSKGVSALSRKVGQAGQSLSGLADDFAIKATGATGKEASQFADDAGRQLLDRNLIRFGDSPEAIAGRLGGAVDEAGASIGKILDDLDSQGVTSSVDNVIAKLDAKMRELSEIPGNEKIVRQLQGTIDDLYERGQSNLPVSIGEKAKRNFQAQTNYASPEAEKKATAIAGRAFREESERAAEAANPAVADLFKKEKETLGLLKPIQKAAERRTQTLNQSIGGLGDIATEAVTGGQTLGAAALARRAIAPRLASSMAVSTDKLAQIALAAPQRLGKFSSVIGRAAQRDPRAVAATHFVLQQQHPEYREVLRRIAEEDGEE